MRIVGYTRLATGSHIRARYLIVNGKETKVDDINRTISVTSE